jgi:hypothetical protein
VDHVQPSDARRRDRGQSEGCEAYLTALTGNDVPAANVASFAKNGARMLRWIMENSHVAVHRDGGICRLLPAYSRVPGRAAGRSTRCPTMRANWATISST